MFTALGEVGAHEFTVWRRMRGHRRRVSMGLIIILCFVVFLAVFYIPPILYFKKGWFKRFFHDLMKWHRPDENTPIWCDGCSDHCVCKYCGEEIMQDSQGNWFSI